MLLAQQRNLLEQFIKAVTSRGGLSRSSVECEGYTTAPQHVAFSIAACANTVLIRLEVVQPRYAGLQQFDMDAVRGLMEPQAAPMEDVDKQFQIVPHFMWVLPRVPWLDSEFKLPRALQGMRACSMLHKGLYTHRRALWYCTCTELVSERAEAPVDQQAIAHPLAALGILVPTDHDIGGAYIAVQYACPPCLLVFWT